MKKQLVKYLFEELRESLISEAGVQHQAGQVGRNMGPYLSDKKPEEQFLPYRGMVPAPRTRIPSIEDYTKVYSFLMGKPSAATDMPLKDIMAHLDSKCPISSSQAVADYLVDRARIK
jgi:hypothetical protein